MKPIRPVPPGRTVEQVWNHFQIEKAIAERLMAADREERRVIYATMYDELFRQVPDHPRLSRRRDESRTDLANAGKYSLLDRFLDPSLTYVEFAPGDCRFAYRVAGEVERVIGVDISDQREPEQLSPVNFELVVYDGYDLGVIPENSVDLVFSDQLLEHLHPEDAVLHFDTIHRILRPGGRYVFRTSHLFTGPHDISRYFCHEPQGFHLQEWTFRKMARLIRERGYSRFAPLLSGHGYVRSVPYVLFALEEMILDALPKALRAGIAKYVVPSVCGVAIK
ncbi:MAG: class I SAM-dependent methyltransferase [bacterium]|nr:class I SAM-dependent methyltransferase [bacterium]